MSYKKTVFTRRELHELVWSKPLSELGPMLGISDRGLGKICARHLVPSPPRGYWAKLEAGQPVKITPLRAVGHAPLDRIEINSTTTDLSDAARARVQMEAASRLQGVEQASLLRPTQKRVEPKSTGKAIQSSFIEGPFEKIHTSVRATAKALRKGRLDKCDGVSATDPGQCGVIVHRDRAERAINFLHNLAIGLEARNLRLIPNGSSMVLSVGSDKVSFTLLERTRREKHVPTSEEQALHERNQAKRDKAIARSDWNTAYSIPYNEPWDEYDRIYTGELIFTVDIWADGLRKTWADGKMQTVEKMFDAILSGLELLLSHEKERREKNEKDERDRKELARRREMLKLRREREEKRLKYMQELIEHEKESAYIRNWLAVTPKTDHSTEFGRMLAWAQSRLEALEAQTNPDVVNDNLQKSELFPKEDPLHDPLGDPPARSSYW